MTSCCLLSYSERKKVAYRCKFFPLRIDPLIEGRQNENDRFVSPESISMHH